MDRVKGKVAIVTGGAMGIGGAASALLAKEGAKVAIADIDDAAANAHVAEIRKAGGAASFWHMDVTNEREIEAVFAEVAKKYGNINILVNNAGIPGGGKPSHEMTEEEFEKVLNIDLKGVFRCTKHIIPYMLKAGGGSIVNMSSMLGIIAAGDPVYHAAKGGVRLLTKGDASVYAKDHIRVNSVHPGLILTPGFLAMGGNRGGQSDDFLKSAGSRVPLGRMGTPEDIANGILFLASDESGYMTGSELVIDGGFIMV
ncbi:MAG: short-chain dehydrogenase [Chloroflexi bacterium RBG_16_57_8]|nr:MAG: short-chain dehydrogenase [Chloroflexi bacterium RBG_16_57_8]